jgi:hypothetical protein
MAIECNRIDRIYEPHGAHRCIYRSAIQLCQALRRCGARANRDGDEYELLDKERDFGRASHLHDLEWFAHTDWCLRCPVVPTRRVGG